jgi:xanthine dehydrogenase accessory factor
VVSNPLKIIQSLSDIVDKTLGIDQFDEISVDYYTAIILMSHDYKTDKLNFRKALRTTCRYIGMLGPRVRAEKIFKELEEDGIVINDKDYERVFAPAGLDIGALSPEEIALSLIAEIRAVFSDRYGGFLKLRKTTIHERNGL